MRNKIKTIERLVRDCLEEDRNNPKWNSDLLSALAKLEHYTSVAKGLTTEEEDPLFLTRQTVRQFKAVRGD
jgi:hypothetical protein